MPTQPCAAQRVTLIGRYLGHSSQSSACCMASLAFSTGWLGSQSAQPGHRPAGNKKEEHGSRSIHTSDTQCCQEAIGSNWTHPNESHAAAEHYLLSDQYGHSLPPATPSAATHFITCVHPFPQPSVRSLSFRFVCLFEMNNSGRTGRQDIQRG